MCNWIKYISIISRLNRSSSNIVAKPMLPKLRPKSYEIKRPRESLTQKKAKSLRKRM
jgi:hypothetical protein